jgi:hypothetical protein
MANSGAMAIPFGSYFFMRFSMLKFAAAKPIFSDFILLKKEWFRTNLTT